MFFLLFLLFVPLFGHDVEPTREFLQEVEAISVVPSTKTNRETALYKEGIDLLLTSGQIPLEYNRKLKEELIQQSDMNRIRFFTALFARQAGNEAEFQKEFLKAYCHYPDDYLSYKIKGSLYASLFAHARSTREKELIRQATLQNVTEALALQPRDPEMQKLKIAFCRDEERCDTIEKIIQMVGKVPKEDVRYFVVQLVDAGEKKKAQDFLDKAREWYSGSRVIDRSQSYIDKH